jgi:hypothetical protein
MPGLFIHDFSRGSLIFLDNVLTRESMSMYDSKSLKAPRIPANGSRPRMMASPSSFRRIRPFLSQFTFHNLMDCLRISLVSQYVNSSFSWTREGALADAALPTGGPRWGLA